MRLVGGLATLLIGVVLLAAWAVPTQSGVAWAVAAAALVSGAFMVFEAQAGWCALRAMGFKTPI